MNTYTIDASDSTTEAAWNEYKAAQHSLRDQVGVAYRAIDVALQQYAVLAARLGEGGDLAGVAGYHMARAEAILTKEQELLALCAQVMATAQEMQRLSPEDNLFPGVPVGPAPVEEE